jgi:hypothetical protein
MVGGGGMGGFRDWPRGGSPLTYFKQGVGKRGGESLKPTMMEASIKYVTWFV